MFTDAFVDVGDQKLCSAGSTDLLLLHNTQHCVGQAVLIIRIVRKNRRKTAELQKWQNDLPLRDPSQAQVSQQYQMPNRPGHHMVTDTEYMKNRGYDLN